MKILSVSDLRRTPDGVKEQQLKQSCFGNFLAPKGSRRPRGELITGSRRHCYALGKGLLGGLGLRSQVRTEPGGSQQERTRVAEP